MDRGCWLAFSCLRTQIASQKCRLELSASLCLSLAISLSLSLSLVVPLFLSLSFSLALSLSLSLSLALSLSLSLALSLSFYLSLSLSLALSLSLSLSRSLRFSVPLLPSLTFVLRFYAHWRVMPDHENSVDATGDAGFSTYVNNASRESNLRYGSMWIRHAACLLGKLRHETSYHSFHTGLFAYWALQVRRIFHDKSLCLQKLPFPATTVLALQFVSIKTGTGLVISRQSPESSPTPTTNCSTPSSALVFLNLSYPCETPE